MPYADLASVIYIKDGSNFIFFTIDQEFSMLIPHPATVSLWLKFV